MASQPNVSLKSVSKEKAPVIIDRANFDALLQALKKRGYQLVGPTIHNNAIVYDTLESAADLPVGYTDRQEKGAYRLEKRSDKACFGYVMGPQSWKKYLFPNRLKLWEAQRNNGSFSITPTEPQTPRYAFIGVRPCELTAIDVLDRVLLQGSYVDPHYQARRKGIFILTVNCTEPGSTCFCASMDTGPQASKGFDLALTEVLEKKRHYFLAESGSKLGEEILREIPCQPAAEAEIDSAAKALEKASRSMGRTLDTAGIKELIADNFDNPFWDRVAKRCLSCANCTMVCPTCFCTTVEDTTELAGNKAARVRRWDSCFTLEFTYIHGGSVRQTVMSRYRQWMSHKLGRWYDQFGISGCVGCGRCITWCPVGIDITEEARALRESKKRSELK